MNTDSQMPTALLPSGLFDLTGAEAEAEAALVNAFLAHFRSCSYVQVQPPLMEFTASLFAGNEESALAKRSFRLADPISQQMMALRADMTMQIARIAGSTLKASARPLRLCYAGQTLRNTPDAMRATRQFRQIGIELFGSPSPYSDVEVIQTALGALHAQGISEVTVDLSSPQLLPLLVPDFNPAQQADLLHAIHHKDTRQIEAMGYPLLAALCSITLPVDDAIKAIQNIGLDDSINPILEEIATISRALKQRVGDSFSLTYDPLEMRGFGYHNGVSFAFYAAGCPQELGRGGRYLSPYGEEATGFTLYAEDVLPLTSRKIPAPSLLLPEHCHEAIAAAWRAKGYQTRYQLDAGESADFVLGDDLNTLVKGVSAPTAGASYAPPQTTK